MSGEAPSNFPLPFQTPPTPGRLPLLLPLLYALAAISAAQLPPVAPASCPQACFCNAPSRIVYCSRRGLPRIPPGIPADSLQLNLNGNVFHNSVLSAVNFTGLDSLEHLYMSECGIERIELGTFLALANLKWLDLSNNRIRAVSELGFSGLTLQHLFLNGNRHIHLVAESFEGLITTGLYLHDCSLSRIAPEVLAPLNATLKYLWLNGNELDRLDRRLSGMFASLSHLRLGSNPLHCNCEAVWLKELFDSNDDVFKGAVFPSCLTPQRLRGRYFNELALTDFRCQAPMFNNIETTFGTHSGRLKCTASGDPAPTLYWIQPSGKTTKYGPPSDDEARFNEGVLALTAGVDDRPVQEDGQQTKDGLSLFGMYICIANNDAGNVTLTINVSWPLLRLSDVLSTSASPPIGSAAGRTSGLDPSQRSHIPSDATPAVLHPAGGVEQFATTARVGWPGSRSASPSGGDYTVVDKVDFRPGVGGVGGGEAGGELGGRENGVRLFTVTEFVCAVLGAHIATLIICIVIIPIVYRTRWRKRLLEKQRQHKLHHQLHYDLNADQQHQHQQQQVGLTAAEGTPSRNKLLQHQQLTPADYNDDSRSETGYLNGNGTAASCNSGRPHRPIYLTDYLVTSLK